MSLALNEFQKAVYARLSSQLPTVPIYDYVPANSAFPYIRLGFTTALAADTKTEDAQEFTIQIHIFTKSAGRKDAETIMQNLYTALNKHTLVMTGFSCVFCRCEYSQADVEPQEGNNDHYQHGVMRFRSLITTN